MADLLRFSHTAISTGYREWSKKKITSKPQVENALLMPEFRWEWPNCFVIFLHFEPLCSNWTSVRRHSLPEYLWSQCTHFLIMILCHVTKLKSSETIFLSVTARSLYSNSLRGRLISIQQSTFVMWWMGDSHHGYVSSLTLSCQDEPKSLRTVSSTLLNLCHEEFMQFSKVYLIK